MGKTIEEEIQSDKFRSVYHKAALNLMVTASWLSGIHQEIFRKYNITAQQYNVLRILRGQHPLPCTLLSIRERMIDKMSDVSRIVERLRVAGYLERTSCSEDRRAVDVIITKKGLDLLRKLDKEEDEMDNALSGLTQTEAKQLSNLLDKLRK
jgi:DNA-binding MarR family transcriptional regulator